MNFDLIFNRYRFNTFENIRMYFLNWVYYIENNRESRFSCKSKKKKDVLHYLSEQLYNFKRYWTKIPRVHGNREISKFRPMTDPSNPPPPPPRPSATGMHPILIDEKTDFTGEDTKMRFNMKPGPGDSDFEQWQSAMKMVARLPDGVPHEFRNTVRTYPYVK